MVLLNSDMARTLRIFFFYQLKECSRGAWRDRQQTSWMGRLRCCRCWKQKTARTQWVTGRMRWWGFSVSMSPTHYWKACAHGLGVCNSSNACVKTSDIAVAGMTSNHAVNIHLSSVQKSSSATGPDASTQKSLMMFLKFVTDFQAVLYSHTHTRALFLPYKFLPTQNINICARKWFFLSLLDVFVVTEWIPSEACVSRFSTTSPQHVWSGWMMPFQNDWCFV